MGLHSLLRNPETFEQPWKSGPSEPALSLSKGPRKSLSIIRALAPVVAFGMLNNFSAS